MDTETTTVLCPRCRSEITVLTCDLGKHMHCPKCGRLIQVGAAHDDLPIQAQVALPKGRKKNQFVEGGTEQRWQEASVSAGGSPINPYATPESVKTLRRSRRLQLGHRDPNAPIPWGVILMTVAAVWFFGGLAFGMFFFYPPILFTVGLIWLVHERLSQR